jgi:hypothetical protein
MPDRLARDSIASDFAHPLYSPEDDAIYTSPRTPLIPRRFLPTLDRNRTDVFSFANQIGDHPVLLAQHSR